jgi:hypothetical protein
MTTQIKIQGLVVRSPFSFDPFHTSNFGRAELKNMACCAWSIACLQSRNFSRKFNDGQSNNLYTILLSIWVVVTR